MTGVESKIVDEKPKDNRPVIDREKVRKYQEILIPGKFDKINNLHPNFSILNLIRTFLAKYYKTL